MTFPSINNIDTLAVDTETTGLYWYKGHKPFGFSVAFRRGNAIESLYCDIRQEPNGLRWLSDAMAATKRVVNHNIKFDMHMLREVGCPMPEGKVECTMVRAALINEHEYSFSLDALLRKYVKMEKNEEIYTKLAELFGGHPTRKVQMANIHRAPPSVVAPYAKIDAEGALRLWEWQKTELDKQDLRDVWVVERALTGVLCRMEHGGIRVDGDRAHRASKEITSITDTIQKEINRIAGYEVNPNPSNSLKKLLNPIKNELGQWVLMDGTVCANTEAGAASIGAEALRRMKHPVGELILRYRKLAKARDTFINGHVLGHMTSAGYVHPNFNQTKTEDDLGTGTGRLSCSEPAMQQIHKRDVEIAKIVRALFLPDKGLDFICRDWAQMDFRVFAHYVNNARVNAMYDENPMTDFHQLVSDMTGIPRKPRFAGDANAKQINLGMIFGMGQGKLALEMGLPFTKDVWYTAERSGCEDCRNHSCKKHAREVLRPGPEAVEVFDRYHDNIPGVKTLLDNASSVAKSKGYVRTILGRRIRFPGGQFTHKAGGLIFQGSAADALKVKLVEGDALCQQYGYRLMLNVHDEFDVSADAKDTTFRKAFGDLIEKFDGIGTPIRFRIPIRSDEGVGENWYEASKE